MPERSQLWRKSPNRMMEWSRRSVRCTWSIFDSVAGIARAKYELIESLPRGGTAVLNADDEYVSQFGRDFQRQSDSVTD